ncbi:uncharacterized protein LOC135954534 [Calliphora vicina]|uniref:uncharacterized protein LOC135954534 n=1 Tax=Calliphora vicina TaxID=7373 RepID=UPI00325B269D
MLTKFLRKLSFIFSLNSHTSKLITNCWRRCPQMPRHIHNWKRQMEFNNEKRKIIPRLVYLHNPWTYFLTKIMLYKFQLFWDPEFVESEFIRGSKQAAVVLTNIIRDQNALKIRQFTTPTGYQQITQDMMLSRNDIRLKLVRFEAEHLRRAIPMKVTTKQNYDRRYCFIDMLFVGLRNTKDFDSIEETVEISDILRKLDLDLKTPYEVLSVPHRIVFAEIFIRFRRNYSENPADVVDPDWSVSFYKILTFDVLNYNPKQ